MIMKIKEKDGKYSIEVFYPQIIINHLDSPEITWKNPNDEVCRKLGVETGMNSLYGIIYGVFDDKLKTFTVCKAEEATHIMVRETVKNQKEIIIENSYAELYRCDSGFDDLGIDCSIAIYSLPIDNWRDWLFIK